MIRHNWKPLLGGWTLGVVIATVALNGAATLGLHNAWQSQIAIVSAGLVFVALIVHTIKRKRKPLRIGLLIGIVMTPPILFGLIVMAYLYSWGGWLVIVVMAAGGFILLMIAIVADKQLRFSNDHYKTR